MGSFSIFHWLIVLGVVVVVFGTKKLRNIGSDMGAAVKGFKDGMKDGVGSEVDKAPVGQVAHSEKTNASTTIDVDAKQKL